MTPSTRWLATTIAVFAAFAPRAAAQRLPSTPAESVSVAPDAAIIHIASDRTARNALLYLRSLADPEPEDFRIAALVLEQAAMLDPTNAGLLRLLVEAWFNAHDDARVADATRRLVRLDPTDTVAQLRLISDRIKRLQDVESRQRVYDRLLIEGAGALDESIRSRLALDDALLAREIGDEDRFVERLTLATQLDPTNKPAAVLASQYSLSRLDDPLARVELLANVVLADPLDPAAHLDLAEELMAHGAYDSAMRFFKHGQSLYAATDDPAGDDLRGRMLLATFARDGAESILNLFADGERSQRYQAHQQRNAAILAGEDPDAVPDFHPDRLNESLRLAAALALGDRVEAAEALTRIESLSAERVAALREALAPAPGDENKAEADAPAENVDEPANDLADEPAGAPASTPEAAPPVGPPTEPAAEPADVAEVGADQSAPADADAEAPEPLDPAFVESEVAWETRDVLWRRLWAGLELDDAEATIKALAGEADGADGDAPPRDDPLNLFRGLLAAQRGRAEEARRLLTPLRERDPRARIGLILAAERAENQEGAIEQLAHLAQDMPGSLPGVWARARLTALRKEPVAPTPTERALEEYVSAMPEEIDHLVAEPRTILDLHVSNVQTEYRPFDRIEVALSLRNISPLPLAVGPSEPISTNLLLAPRLTVGTTDARERLKPEIISLNHKLRLKPGESLDTVVWADQGRLGQINDLSLLASGLLRFRVIQNFTITPKGEHIPTPLSLTAGTDVVRRLPIALPTGGMDGLPDLIRRASGRRLIEAILLTYNAITLMRAQPDDADAKALVQDTADALFERLAATNRYERVMITELLPRAESVPALEPVQDALRDDPDTLVRLAYVFVRVEDLDDPIFALIDANDDPVAQEVSDQLRVRMRERLDAKAAADAAANDE